jgi:hypothetical protein
MFAGEKVPFETLSSAEHPDIPNEDPENRRFMNCMEEPTPLENMKVNGKDCPMYYGK